MKSWRRMVPCIWPAELTVTLHLTSLGVRTGQVPHFRITLKMPLSPSPMWQENMLGSMCVQFNTSTGLWQLPLLSLWCVSTNLTVIYKLMSYFMIWNYSGMFLASIYHWYLSLHCLFPDLPVILPGSGCVDQAEVMTCLCVSQGVPSPLIVWPLLELNTERCSPTTSVLGSSVNSTISLPVGNHNNTTVECVSSNVVGVVREKLQVTQNKSQEKQRGKYVCQVTWLESHSFPFPPNVCNIEDVLYI